MHSDGETLISVPAGFKRLAGIFLGSGAFSYCTSLKEITVPDGVTVLESSLFSGCTKLGTIVIPESVVSVKSNALYDTAWIKAEQKKSPLVILNG